MVMVVIAAIVAIVSAIIVVINFVNGKTKKALISFIVFAISIVIFFASFFASMVKTTIDIGERENNRKSNQISGTVDNEPKTNSEPKTKNKPTANNENEENQIVSEDGKFSAILPEEWEEVTDYSLHDIAELQMQRKNESAYMIALIENKSDLDMGFTEYSELILESFAGSITDAEISEPETIYIDGREAHQYLLKGKFNFINITYLITYVDGENHYAQIICWSTASVFDVNREIFEEITNSIKGL